MADFFTTLSRIFVGLGKTLSFIRSLLVNLVFFGLAALILVSILHKKEPSIPDHAVLKLRIAGDIVEQKQEEDPFSDFLAGALGLSTTPSETRLQDILDILDQARTDPKIKALLLDLKSMGNARLNQLEVIGSALTAFKLSKKEVIAAEDYYNQSQYFLASHADRIFLNPMGAVHLRGFSYYRSYFNDALEKLKINFHVFQVGSFKSATEPLTRNSMSTEDRSQSKAWLGSLWDHYVAEVSAQRGLTDKTLNAYINAIPENLRETNGDLAQLALKHGLVDELTQRHELREYLARLTGVAPKPLKDSDLVTTANYLKTVTPSFRSVSATRDTIGLIVLQGTIVSGTSTSGTIGADTVAQLLREAGTTDNIKAVVLRIDSGGGSAFASEIIRQELLNLKKSGKPVIVSMGSYAASGAYWLAADADEIWASPNSLTGSIGIFMAVPTFEEALNGLGVYRDGIGTTTFSSALDLSQPLSKETEETIQLTIDHGYSTFVKIVADGRNLPITEVEQLAQGKIYTGEAAQGLGLVDKLGSFADAIDSAGERAGLTDYAVSTLLPKVSWQDIFLHRFSAESNVLFPEHSLVASLKRFIFGADEAVQRILLFNDPNGMYAHCMISTYQTQ